LPPLLEAFNKFDLAALSAILSFNEDLEEIDSESDGLSSSSARAVEFSIILIHCWNSTGL